MKIALILLLSVAINLHLFAATDGWRTDFTVAQNEAATSKKDLLIDFTGSDWCGACIVLSKEVFSQQTFKDGVTDKFILVKLDFPNDKSKLTEATLKQNDQLRQKYSIEAFPSIILTDASGKPYAITGYLPGGPESYLKHLDELRAKKGRATEALKSAVSSEGVPKARLLAGMLNDMNLTKGMMETFYADVIEQIKTADPDDTVGFVKASVLKDQLAKFQRELSFFAQGRDFASALRLIDKTIKGGGFEKPEVQQMMGTRAVILAEMKKFDEALKAVDDAKAFAPGSELAPSLDDFKKKLQTAKELSSSSTSLQPKTE